MLGLVDSSTIKDNDELRSKMKQAICKSSPVPVDLCYLDRKLKHVEIANSDFRIPEQ